MADHAIPDAALGAILGATITGLVSLLGLIISKENKISEFRQSWIDALRSELASLVAHLYAIHAGLANIPADDWWAQARDDYLGANRCFVSVRLRLNPREKSSQTILELLDALEKCFAPGVAPSVDQLAPLEKKLVSESHALLKREWDRVRHGELFFRIARLVSFVVLIGGLSLLILLVMRPAP
jgi:hypothetical protein